MAQGKPYQWFVLPVYPVFSNTVYFLAQILTLRAECNSLVLPGLLLFPFLFGLTERSSIRKINKTMFLRSQLLSGYADPWAMLRWVCALGLQWENKCWKIHGEEEVLTDSLRVTSFPSLTCLIPNIDPRKCWHDQEPRSTGYFYLSVALHLCPIYFRKAIILG